VENVSGAGTVINTPTQAASLAKVDYAASYTEVNLSELILVFNGF